VTSVTTPDRIWQSDGHFGERVRALRARIPMNREQFAEAIEASTESVYRWEVQGAVPRSAATIERVAKVLGRPVAYLLYGEDDDA